MTENNKLEAILTQLRKGFVKVPEAKQEITALYEVPSVEEIENALGKIEAPIDENLFEIKGTQNPAIVILKPKWTNKIAVVIHSLILNKRRK
jgi:hypothetical protein